MGAPKIAWNQVSCTIIANVRLFLWIILFVCKPGTKNEADYALDKGSSSRINQACVLDISYHTRSGISKLVTRYRLEFHLLGKN